MKTASRFRRLPEPSSVGDAKATIHWNGRAIEARTGDNLAAILLADGETEFRRTPASGQARGPFCMMGSCFDCLLTVDGEPNRQACMTTVTDGMVVETGAPRSAIGPAVTGGTGDET